MSNICWAFAKMEFPDIKDLFAGVAGQHAYIAKDGNPQNLSNVVWAFATLGYKSDQLFSSIAGEHERLARDGGE